ncbi:MAG: hypothetical protein K2X82_22155 [Gemmataceae bacterium]|nr:hypothetical protein [Gemmataceae bacterium]
MTTGTVAAPSAVVLGRYALGHEISAGPDGRARRGRDRRTGRPVVVTVFDGLADDPDRHHRTARAFRAAARLDHPNVVRTLDFGVDAGSGYAVTEPPDGAPLAARVAGGGPLEPADVGRMVAELADALDYAHAGGLVHDGITPDRVFVRADGGVRLGGWGFAAAAGRWGSAPAEDVADLAEVVYLALTGRPWPEGFDPEAGGVSDTIRRAIDPDPAQRPVSAGAFAQSLVDDRRVDVRHPIAPGLMGAAGADDPLGAWPVIVQDVSAGGVGLLIGRRVEPGTALRIAFGEGVTVRARVVRAGAKAFGHWFHGCAFAEPLAADALAGLLRRAGEAVVVS